MASNYRVEPIAGLLSERPLPTRPQVYFATDDGTTWISVGGVWIQTGARAERIMYLSPTIDPIIWKNMPAARTELLGVTWLRAGADCRGLQAVRLTPNIVVPGPAGSFVAVEWSVDELTWANLAPGSDVPIDVSGHFIGPLMPIDPAAKTPPAVTIRMVGYGGDGQTDPEFGRMTIVLR